MFRSRRMLLVGVLVLLAGCSAATTPNATAKPTAYSGGGQNIQLNDFTPNQTARPTTSPRSSRIPLPPGPFCPTHVKVPYPLECSCGIFGQTAGDAWFGVVHPGGQYPDIDRTTGRTVKFDYYDPASAIQKQLLENGTGYLACIGAPVIYLYPQKPTLVSVRIDTPGNIYISEPQYPRGGWQNILANPDGSLVYQGKPFPFLYYETAVESRFKPTEGVLIEKTKLEPMLSLLTHQLGLLPHEQQDFLDYWLPRLEPLQGQYILFSIVDNVEKNRVDNVVISPEPNTRIEFLVYYKPVEKSHQIAPLKLDPVPQRKGFTMVEWGGFIDTRGN